jgi:hypothetical protein
MIIITIIFIIKCGKAKFISVDKDVCLRPFAYWDRVFEYHRGGGLFIVR